MIEMIPAHEKTEEFLSLLREYTEMINKQDASVAGTLSSQHLEEELKDVDKKYGPPGGRRYLALVDKKTAGCVALARNDDDYCELKRLYVKPEYRGRGLSKILCSKVIEDARAIGYRYMRLDTFPFMTSALRLYEEFGFEYIGKYNDNPAENAIFMQLKL